AQRGALLALELVTVDVVLGAPGPPVVRAAAPRPVQVVRQGLGAALQQARTTDLGGIVRLGHVLLLEDVREGVLRGSRGSAVPAVPLHCLTGQRGRPPISARRRTVRGCRPGLCARGPPTLAG